jgi:maleate isomerase
MAAPLDEPGVSRTHLSHELDGGLGTRARLGLIVLATDQTIEHEWRLILAGVEGVALYQSRIWNEPQITPETLAAMEGQIATHAAAITPGLPLSVVAFGCTSAAMVIGEERVFERLRSVRPEARFTTPITAAFAAFRAFGARHVAVLTPYRDDVNQAVRRYIEGRGFTVPVLGSFNEEDDRRAARISVPSIRDAAVELGRSPSVDAVFVSCTSLRVAEAARGIEAKPWPRAITRWLGIPSGSPGSAISCRSGAGCSSCRSADPTGRCRAGGRATDRRGRAWAGDADA